MESHGEWWLAQLAVSGTPTEPFWVHKSVRDDPRYHTEDGFMVYLCSSADSMLEQFGDARKATYAA
jgi:hypothetical protein